MTEKHHKPKVIGSSITTVVSLSLVLFMLGLLGIIILNTKKLADNLREKIGFQIILNETAKDTDIVEMQRKLDLSHYVKNTEYITKEQAAKTLQEDLGEDFIEFLGVNPLLPAINVHLNADYANTDSIDWIQKSMLNLPFVKEVIYQKSMINQINDNVKKIGFTILVFTGLLMVIALALINNTIRLSIYSKRFIIKTMQLVGATQGFIRWPFIFKGIKHGIYGALIAIVMLIALLYFAQKQLPELAELQDFKMLGMLFSLVIGFGIIISWISTSMAVRKYLRLKTNALY
ncbi:MAG: permease-like cell division protein FtsX [Bacteroidia bacterium]